MTGILDPAFINAIKKFEGYSANPYWDYKQYTSGYGTRASPGEVIDPATAEQRLNSELEKAAGYVDGLHPQMPPGVRNALTSLTYNAGPKWIQSGLGEMVRAGDWEGAKSKLLEYNKAGGEVNPGLVNRRQQEASWFDAAPAEANPQAPQMPAYAWTPGSNQAQPQANQQASAAPAGPSMSQQQAPSLTFEQIGKILGLEDPPPLQPAQFRFPMGPSSGPFPFRRA